MESMLVSKGFKSGLGVGGPQDGIYWNILKEVVMNSGIPMTLVHVSSQFCIFLHKKKE